MPPTFRPLRTATGLAVTAAVLVGCTSPATVSGLATESASGQAQTTGADPNDPAATSSMTTGADGTPTPMGADEEASLLVGGETTDPGVAGNALPAGKYQGYIASVTTTPVAGNDMVTLAFDKADLLTGDAAAEAAKAQGQTLDGDFFVLNTQKTVRLLPLGDEATANQLVGGSPTLSPGDVQAISPDQLVEVTVDTADGRTWVSDVSVIYLP